MESIGIVLTPKGGYILADCADLDIHAAGCTVKEALDSFHEDFQFAVRAYVEKAAGLLSKDAEILSKKLEPFADIERKDEEAPLPIERGASSIMLLLLYFPMDR